MRQGKEHCVKCDQDFPTTAQLQRHLDKFHMYKFLTGVKNVVEDCLQKQVMIHTLFLMNRGKRNSNVLTVTQVLV